MDLNIPLSEFVDAPSEQNTKLMSLRRRSSWAESAGLQCIDGIPHDRGPCTAVLGYLDADRWPLLVPAS